MFTLRLIILTIVKLKVFNTQQSHSSLNALQIKTETEMITTSVINTDCTGAIFTGLLQTAHTYHFSFGRTGTGAWKTIFGGCFGFFFRKLKLFHIQTIRCNPLIQALVDFKKFCRNILAINIFVEKPKFKSDKKKTIKK